ncbi:M15 family metallopeptidase [Kitasatospora sp. NPDC096147]|uniref:M15 family metallopeptidase n=1 Tax=Kitasatospora sp. NPDC096147 TaxID=3364093 RepID=UPI00380B2687
MAADTQRTDGGAGLRPTCDRAGGGGARVGRSRRTRLVVGTVAVAVLGTTGAWVASSGQAGLRGITAMVSGASAGVADGAMPGSGRVSPFDKEVPAVGKLDPALLEALQKATVAARAKKIEIFVTSGWRSRDYQQGLLDRAVVEHGTLDRARQYVNTPDASTHVSGKAVDVGATDAAYWMAQYGPEFGLCQVYANEIWHYELLTTPGGTCPAMLPDAAG